MDPNKWTLVAPIRAGAIDVTRAPSASPCMERRKVPALPCSLSFATVGAPAPDFVVPDFRTRASTNLKRWLGKPVVLIFFQPNSITVDPLLRFGQRVPGLAVHRL